MPELRRRYFNSRKSYADYFKEVHNAGALDAKTKGVDAPCPLSSPSIATRAVSHFAGAKKLGATDEEIEETIQLAGSVGAGVILAMADRARDASDEHHYWWRPARPKA